ncbi:MAG: YitT family protein [Anaerolineae bacterium]|nr:YitT family protein [Anaerolineae bacterium]
MNGNRRIPWLKLIFDVVLLAAGALISAVGVIVFQVPFNIAPGGVSGLAIIISHLAGGLPIGLLVLIGNIPIQLVAYRILGGWRSIIATLFAVILYSVLIDILTPVLAGHALSDDVFLNALYAGVVGGVGGGLVYRAGGTLGGTSTLGRILQVKYGTPLSSSTLYTDSGVVLLAGLVFGWEGALYAIVALFVGGAVSDYILEGPSVIRTATIITDYPDTVAQAIIQQMGRGVTSWQGTGMFTHKDRGVLFVTVGRQQVGALRRVVREADVHAFLVIGQGHAAYGQGFREISGDELVG